MDEARMRNPVFPLFHRAIEAGEKPFIALDDGRRVTLQSAFASAGQFANTLKTLGVKPGDRVAAIVEKSAEALIVYLACLRAGIVYLPLNSSYTSSEVGYFVEDAGPRLILCDPQRHAEIADLARKVGGSSAYTLGSRGLGDFLDLAKSCSPEFEDVARAGDDLAAILYTSGTTGRPKGAMLTRDNLLSNAQALTDTWQMTSTDILIHALPIFHTHGLFVATNTVLYSGASMLFQQRFDANAILKLLPRATMLMGVPTFYSRLLSLSGLDRTACKNIRLFISGSAPLSAETHRQFLTQTGHAILERYGMSETGMITSNPLHGDRRAGTVGFPLSGIQIRIAEPERGGRLPTGEIGVVEVKGPNVCKGYWRAPEKTTESFRRDGFFITGDLGFVDGDGYLSLVGRDRDLVISGGLNVYPAEVEAHIDAFPGVAESAVIGIPHPDLGEGVTAVVAAREGMSLVEKEMQDALTMILARYKTPKRIIVVQSLPRNAMGKVQKNILRDRYASIYQDS